MADADHGSPRPSTSSPTPAPPTSSVKAQARMIVPDVARALSLLGIAVANIPTAWLSLGAAETKLLGSISTGLDQVLAVLSTLFVHNRGLPLFTTLLGFGVGLIAMS